MKKIITIIIACFLLLNYCNAQTTKKKPAPVKTHKSKSNGELKTGIKEGWRGVKAAGKAVGHTSKRVAKSVAKEVKK